MEEEQQNSPLPNTDQLETTVNELVEVIKQQEEQKIEEKTLIEEQLKIEEQEQQEQEIILKEEQLVNEEKELAKEQADTQFKEQIIKYMSVQAPPQIDYTGYLVDISSQLSSLHSQNETIIEQNVQIIEQNEILITGSNTTLTYGIFYIPLVIIIFLLWKFFSTFLRSFR